MRPLLSIVQSSSQKQALLSRKLPTMMVIYLPKSHQRRNHLLRPVISLEIPLLLITVRWTSPRLLQNPSSKTPQLNSLKSRVRLRQSLYSVPRWLPSLRCLKTSLQYHVIAGILRQASTVIQPHLKPALALRSPHALLA